MPKAASNGITDQKSHVSSHLDLFYLMNAMVLLMTPLASCDAPNQKCHVTPHFNRLDPRNSMVH